MPDLSYVPAQIFMNAISQWKSKNDRKRKRKRKNLLENVLAQGGEKQTQERERKRERDFLTPFEPEKPGDKRKKRS